MSSRPSSVFIAARFLLASAVSASAEANNFAIELNDVVNIETGCRLVYVAFNGTGQVLEKTSYDVFTFDKEGRVTQSLEFQFGSFRAGKTKVMQFDLPDQPCSKISRLLVNEATECVVAGQPSSVCLDALEPTTRTSINFGF